MNCSILFLLSLFFCCSLAISSSNSHYPNSIYEDDDYDDEFDRTDEDGDYMADQPSTDKQSHRILSPEQFQNFLYHFKIKVLNEPEVSTIKDKNFTYSLNDAKIERKKSVPFKSEIVDDDNDRQVKEKINKIKNKKTTDWFVGDGIQSDQPSSTPQLDSNGQQQLQTAKPTDWFSDTNSKSNNLQSPVSFNAPYDSSDKNSDQKNVKLFPNPSAIGQGYPKWSLNRQPTPLPYPKASYQVYPSGSNIQPRPYSPIPPQSQSYLRPYSQIAVPSPPIRGDWTCQMSPYDNCSITNDVQTGPLFQMQSNNYFGSSNWYLTMDTSKVPPNKIGGRLITPYIPFNQASKGCLTLNYITVGDEIDKIIVHQQDTDNHCIWAANVEASSRPRENFTNLTINFSKSDPRFFIEVYMKRLNTRQSAFSLGKIHLKYNQSCQNDQTNYCAVPPSPLPSSSYPAVPSSAAPSEQPEKSENSQIIP